MAWLEKPVKEVSLIIKGCVLACWRVGVSACRRNGV
jgi:hypothetical protein